ncbi:MAG: hypothetical protein OXC60_14860 [Litoreibacter sp.]|nr:hypothetical protein [Litoreibacter sp.]
MSTFFKAIGVLMILLGALDFGLQTLGISLWRVAGFEPWRVIGNKTYAFAIGYGALTIFVANYLKRKREAPTTIVDLSDPFIGADAHYVTRPAEETSWKVELSTVLRATAWGTLVAAIVLILVVRLVPGMDAALFPETGDGMSPQTRRALVTGGVIATALPLLFGVFVLRLRDGVSVTAMVAGWLVTAAMISAAVLQSPPVGQALYGAQFMSSLHRELGYPEGLPEDWSAEKALVLRLKQMQRARRFR